MVVLQGVNYDCVHGIMLRCSFLFAVLLLFSCKSDGAKDLDKAQKQRFSFAELPVPVREHIENYIARIDKAEDRVAFSLDEDIKLKYSRIGGGENWLEDIQNNFHVFTVNGVVMKLKGNQGAPYIIYDSVLYYTKELNFLEDRYKTAVYIGVDLTPFLK